MTHTELLHVVTMGASIHRALQTQGKVTGTPSHVGVKKILNLSPEGLTQQTTCPNRAYKEGLQTPIDKYTMALAVTIAKQILFEP